MIVYTEMPIDSTEKLLEPIREYSKVNIQKTTAFLYISSEPLESKIKIQYHFRYKNAKDLE